MWQILKEEEETNNQCIDDNYPFFSFNVSQIHEVIERNEYVP